MGRIRYIRSLFRMAIYLFLVPSSIFSQSESFESGFESLPWNFGIDNDWVQSSESFSGSYSAKSATNLSNGQSSTLSINVDIPTDGDIVFYKKTSNETNYSSLAFYIDEELQSSWNGENDWSREAFPVLQGNHTFKWIYSKTGNIGECASGEVPNCASEGVEGGGAYKLCCSESWVGDSYEDCLDQAYGCDLSCYNNDGGDCGEVYSDAVWIDNILFSLIANAGEDQVYNFEHDGVNGGSVALDGSGSIPNNLPNDNYLWSITNSPDGVIATGISPSIDLEIGEYDVTLTINVEGAVSSDNLLVTVNEPNTPPVVGFNCNLGECGDDGQDPSILTQGITIYNDNGIPGNTTLINLMSYFYPPQTYDPDGATDNLNFAWKKMNDQGVLQGISPIQNLPEGEHSFYLVVSDPYGAIGEAVLNLIVEELNEEPTVSLLSDLGNVCEGQSVELIAEVVDPNNDVSGTETGTDQDDVSIGWTCSDGIVPEDNSLASTSFIVPSINGNAGTLEISCTVTVEDPFGAIATAITYASAFNENLYPDVLIEEDFIQIEEGETLALSLEGSQLIANSIYHQDLVVANIEDLDEDSIDNFRIVFSDENENYTIVDDVIIPDDNFDGSLDVFFYVDDQVDALCEEDTPDFLSIEIDIIELNNPPQISASTIYSIEEDGSQQITDLSISDPDAAEFTIASGLVSPNGTMQLSSNLGVNFEEGTSNGTGEIYFSGNLSSINDALFGLVYSPNENYNGLDSITVLVDDLGHEGAPFDITLKDTLVINIEVLPVNDRPVFNAVSIDPVLDDSGFQSIQNWATNIDDGDPELSQDLEFEVFVSNPDLFITQPVVSLDGTFTFEPMIDNEGISDITVILVDNGSIAGPSNNTSLPFSFEITVNSLNNAPEFSLIGDDDDLQDSIFTITVDEDSYSTKNILIDVAEIPPNETWQTVVYTLEPDLISFADINFSTETGELSIIKKNNGYGSQQFTITAQDDGGTFGGGVDIYSQNFNLIVNPINDPPSIYYNTDPISLSGVFNTGNIIELIHNQTSTGTMYDIVDNAYADENGIERSQVTFSYQWELSDDQDGNNITVLDEDAYTILLTPEESHKYLRAKLIGKDNGIGPPDTQTAVYETDFYLVDNLPPLVNDDVFECNEDIPLVVEAENSVLMNDVDEDQDGLIAFLESEPSYGSVEMLEDGTFTYQPNFNFSGYDSFTYILFDGYEYSESARVDVYVASSNDPPEFSFEDEIVLDEDSFEGQVVPVVVDDIPIDEQVQSVVYSISPQQCEFASIEIDESTGEISFSSFENLFGQQEFTITAQDDGGTDNEGVDTFSKNFTLTVNPVNDNPSFNATATSVVVLEDVGLDQDFILFENIASGPDNESDSLSFQVNILNGQDLFSSIPEVSIIGTSGYLNFELAEHAFGTSVVMFTLNDNNENFCCSNQPISIQVNAVNDAPIVTNQIEDMSLFEDQELVSIDLDLVFDDIEGEELQYSFQVDTDLFSPSIAGSILSIEPNENQNGGFVSINVQANDNQGRAISEDSFDIELLPVNDAPVFSLSSEIVSVNEDFQELYTISVSPDVIPNDEISQDVIYSLIPSPEEVSLVSISIDQETGLVTFSSNQDEFGQQEFLVVAQDDGGVLNGGSDTFKTPFSIDVSPVNDPPTFTINQEVSDFSNEGDPLYFNCGDYAEQGGCNDKQGCFWYDSYCDQSFCNEIGLSAEECVDFGCLWSDNSCSPLENLRGFNLVAAIEDTYEVKNVSISPEDGPSNEQNQTVTYTLIPDPSTITFADVILNQETGEVSFNRLENQNGARWFILNAIDDGENNLGSNSSYIRFFTYIEASNDSPVNTVLPSLESNGFVVGEDIVTSEGAWNDDIDNDLAWSDSDIAYTYKWERSVGGDTTLYSQMDHTTSSYPITAEDSHEFIRSIVVATDNGIAVQEPLSLSSQEYSYFRYIENTLPELVIDSYSVIEDDTLTVGFSERVTANDVDRDEDDMTISLLEYNGNGSLTLNEDGTFLFVPAINENNNLVSESFTYRVSDGFCSVEAECESLGTCCPSQQAVIDILPSNDEPKISFIDGVQFVEDAFRVDLEEDFLGTKRVTIQLDERPQDEVNQIINYTISPDPSTISFASISYDPDAMELQIVAIENRYGEADITLTATDNGGTDNDGDNTYDLNLILSIAAVNDAPLFNMDDDIEVTVFEDIGLDSEYEIANNISPGNEFEDEDLVFNTQVLAGSDLFSVAPEINSSGILTFELAENMYGSSTIKVQLDDGQEDNNLSGNKVFTIVVSPVNDEPVFSFLDSEYFSAETGKIVLYEDFLGSLYISPSLLSPVFGEEDQAVIYEALDLGNAPPLGVSFDDSEGALVVSSILDSNGSSTITLRATDSGGTADGGLNVYEQSFEIEVLPVNDAPGFEYNKLDEFNYYGQIFSGSSCVALFPNGTVSAWGQNNIPVLDHLSNIVEVSSGAGYGLALKSDGTINGWGSNSWDQAAIPDDLSDVVAVEARGLYSLALLSDGTIRSWWPWVEGFVIDASDQTPVPSDLSNVVILEANEDNYLALLSDGTVRAWGDNSYGQASVPEDLSGVVSIGAGDNHSLALLSDGTVRAWGDNSYGQASVPEDLSSVVSIEAGPSISLALLSNGTVRFWGADFYDTLIPDLSNVVSLEVNGNYSLALHSDGTVTNFGLFSCGELPDDFNLISGSSVISKGPVSIEFNEDLFDSADITLSLFDIPGDEESQDVVYSISPSLETITFADVSLNSSTGEVEISKKEDRSGFEILQLTAIDNGGTVGVDMYRRDIALQVNSLNDAPSFTKGNDLSRNEDNSGTGEVSVNGWATEIRTGDPDDNQDLEFQVVNNNNDLFDVQPEIKSTGQLTFTLKENMFGSAEVVATLIDNGSGSEPFQDEDGNGQYGSGEDFTDLNNNGTWDSDDLNINRSDPQTFNISINSVNDAPAFSLSYEQLYANEDFDSDQRVEVFPLTIPDDELSQDVTYSISPSEVDFAVIGFDSQTGEVNVYPIDNMYGSQVFIISAQDDGGTANDGIDVFEKEFLVEVSGVNDAPVNTEPPIINVDASGFSVGDVITGTSGSWNDDIDIDGGSFAVEESQISFTYTYQIADDSDGLGTVSYQEQETSSFEITSAFSHKFIRLKVIAKDNGFEEGDPGSIASAAAFSDFYEIANTVAVTEDDSNEEFTIFEDGSIVVEEGNKSLYITFNDYDVDGDSLFAFVETQPAKGVLQLDKVGFFTYTPETNFYGTDSFTYHVVEAWDQNKNGYIDQEEIGTQESNISTVSIIVEPVNDPPTFVLSDDLILDEDFEGSHVIVRTLDPAPSDYFEDTQNITYSIFPDNLDWVEIDFNPLNGETSFSSIYNKSFTGVQSFTVTATDDGGTSNGGIDTASQSFSLEVRQLNDAPSFFIASSPSQILEDASNEIFELALEIISGPSEYDEEEQTDDMEFVFFSNNNRTLIDDSSLEKLSLDRESGILTFTPEPNQYGLAEIGVYLDDKGEHDGTKNFRYSDTLFFTIDVKPVNDAPCFSSPQAISIAEDSGYQTKTFVSQIYKGCDASNNNQPVSNEEDDVLVFEVLPSIVNSDILKDVDGNSETTDISINTENGSITFEVKNNYNGSILGEILLKDDGGIEDGGVDASAVESFSIEVRQINDPVSEFSVGSNLCGYADKTSKTYFPECSELIEEATYRSFRYPYRLDAPENQIADPMLFNWERVPIDEFDVDMNPEVNRDDTLEVYFRLELFSGSRTFILKDSIDYYDSEYITANGDSMFFEANLLSEFPSYVGVFSKDKDTEMMNIDTTGATLYNWRISAQNYWEDELGQDVAFQDVAQDHQFYVDLKLPKAEISAVPNPVFSDLLDVYFSPDEETADLPAKLYVTSNESGYYQAMFPGKIEEQNIFHSSTQFDEPGQYSFDFQVRDRVLNIGRVVQDIVYDVITQNSGAILKTDSENISVEILPGSVNDKRSIIMVEEQEYRSMIERSSLAMASKTISLKPDGLVLNKKMRISFNLKDFISEDLGYWNFKIMENVNDQWIDIHTDYMNNQLAVAQVNHLGKYALFIDPDAIESLPEEFYFSGNYPNPFNSSTAIKYAIPSESYVKVSVFNVQGQRVNVLVDEVQEPGYKSINWNGKSQSSYVLPSGIYFVMIQQNNATEVKKVMMIK